MTSGTILNTLDDLQKKAVIAKSPVIVNASAGSGKTRCLTTKIIYLIEQGILPGQICAITFTNKAANEMKERLKNKISMGNMQVSTIHSLCVRIIKTFIRYTPLKLPFSIYDDSDQISIIKTIVKSKNLPRDPNEYLSCISQAKSEQSEHLLENDYETIYKTYREILIKNNAGDFDDLLIYAHECLKHEDCANYFSDLWRHILVDEFQDTSIIQYEIINKMYNPNKTKTLFVVADFNQSIYKWRNANPENMNDFIKKYNPSVCLLHYNYRSSQAIINHANNFIQYGKSMIPKTTTSGMVSFTGFNDQEDEANKIARAITKMGNYENTAIICRINARTLFFEKTFAQNRIPYKVIGALPYYKRKVVKDLLSYCKTSLNSSDIESLIRIVNVPKRGFGENKKEQLLHKGWPYLEEMALEMPAIKSFISLLNDIKHMQPLDAIKEILTRTDYRSYLTKETDSIMVNSFLDVVAGFTTLDEFILASTFLEEDTGHGVKLLTAHASKGLEFDNVYVVGVEEGLWPHARSMDMDEESRLYYVSITRARTWLHISYSKNRKYRGHNIEVYPSSLFLKSYSLFNK